VYRKKQDTITDAKVSSAAANADEDTRPKTTRNRKTRETTDEVIDGEERKGGKSRAKSTRRPRN